MKINITPMEIMEDTVEGVKSTMVATRYQIPAWVLKYICLERVPDHATQPATQSRERSL